jgi:hypothetical protein
MGVAVKNSIFWDIASLLLAAGFMLVSCYYLIVPYYSILKMVEICSSETVANCLHTPHGVISPHPQKQKSR